MRDLAILFLHLLATVARLTGPGGARAVVAESVLVKHQLLIFNRSRKRSPNLPPSDRMVAGLCALFMRPGRSIRSAIVFKPSVEPSSSAAWTRSGDTSAVSAMKPGPKGPSEDVIAAVVDMKQRNPSRGSPRIAQRITLAVGLPIKQGCGATRGMRKHGFGSPNDRNASAFRCPVRHFGATSTVGNSPPTGVQGRDDAPRTMAREPPRHRSTRR